ncbi:hypothetical protein EJB05_14043, partial [Eragrostis curvula]
MAKYTSLGCISGSVLPKASVLKKYQYASRDGCFRVKPCVVPNLRILSERLMSCCTSFSESSKFITSKVTITQEQDFCEMTTYSFIFANMSDKCALADFPGTNNWQDLKFFDTMRLCAQQEVNDMLCFQLSNRSLSENLLWTETKSDSQLELWDPPRASVHGFCEHAQQFKHSLVCDMPPHTFIRDDLSSEKDPAEAILHILRHLLGAFADEEIYGSSCQFTQDCRKENLHLRTLSLRT